MVRVVDFAAEAQRTIVDDRTVVKRERERERERMDDQIEYYNFTLMLILMKLTGICDRRAFRDWQLWRAHCNRDTGPGSGGE